jgi:hypothetical protein
LTGSAATAVSGELTGLAPQTQYYYRVVATNSLGTTSGEIKTFTSAPAVGVTVNDAANYTVNAAVTLTISWPKNATQITVSNDGGFSRSSSKTFALSRTIDWKLDDSFKDAIYTKVVYVRFSGSSIDSTRTFSDDIIFDNKSPEVSGTNAVQNGDFLFLSIAASDKESGLSTVEINNGDKTVGAAYSTAILVKASDLGLGVNSATVRKSSLSNLRLRISDRAGNKTSWIAIGSGTTPSISMKKVLSNASLAKVAKISVLKGSKLSISVSTKSNKVCRVSGAGIKGLKAGNCTFKITMKPRKGKSVSKTLTLKVSK